MIDKIKYDLTKLAPSSIYRHLPLGRTHADIVASKLSAGKGGVVPESVAGEDAAASPDINVAHATEIPSAPPSIFPGERSIRSARRRGVFGCQICQRHQRKLAARRGCLYEHRVAFVRRRMHA